MKFVYMIYTAIVISFILRLLIKNNVTYLFLCALSGVALGVYSGYINSREDS